MTEDVQDSPTYSERSSKGPVLIIVFFVVLVLVIVSAGGLYYLTTQNKHPDKTNEISQIPTATPTAKPTPTPELKRNELIIAVLNGSGTAGAARGISAHLTELGYTVKTVGNADGFAYRDITINIKKSKQNYLSLLQKDLEDDPSVSSISANVVDTITTDAEVIVGR